MADMAFPPAARMPIAEEEHEDESSAASRVGLAFGVAVVIAIIAVAVAALFFLRGRPPGDSSAEAGFARDMATHHAQAVQMALIVRDRTNDPVIRTIATDIVLTQQGQIGMMQGWLDLWGLPQSTSGEPMKWMKGNDSQPSMDGMSMGGGTDSQASTRMPGMATSDEVASLETLPVDEMNKQFLTLMIRHHKGGVLMAEAAQSLVEVDSVKSLARGIANAQKVEIAQMEQLLQERS